MTDDLPTELAQGAEFTTEPNALEYYVKVGQRSVAIEYINGHWYYLEFENQHNAYITQADLALTEEQLKQHNLACKVQPPDLNLLLARPLSIVLEKEDDMPMKSTDKGKKVLVYNSSDNEEEFHPAKGPLMPVAILLRAKDSKV